MSDPVKRSKKISIMPYSFGSGDVELLVKNVQIDDQEESVPVDLDSQKVDLDGRTINSTVSFELKVLVSDEVEEIIEENNLDSEARLVVVQKANKVFYRDKLLERKFEAGRTIEEDYELDVENYRGEIELMPLVVSKNGKKLADGKTWTIYLEKPDGVVSEYLYGEWVDFKSDKIPYSDSALYYLDTSGDNPSIYWNSDKESKIFNTLMGDNRGYSGKVKNLTFDGVYLSVYSELFMAAVEDLNEGQRDFDSQWRESVLAELLPKMYPNYDRGSAIDEVWSAWNEDEIKFSTVMTKLKGTLQDNLDLKSDLKTAIGFLE